MADKLRSGEKLTPGKELVSSNGKHRFVYQTDGNLVIYSQGKGDAIWASETHGRDTSELIMQEDGNLVLYYVHDGKRDVVWATQTQDKSGSYLVMHDDGYVVIYQPNIEIWRSIKLTPKTDYRY